MSISPVYDKLILTLSNLASLIPLVYFIQKGQEEQNIIWRDMAILLLASFTSILHHAVEERYYSPSLFKVPKLVENLLLQLDRIFAISAILFLGSWRLFDENQFAVASALIAMILSEFVMYSLWDNYLSIEKRRFMRVILHIYWHLMAEGYIAFLAFSIYYHEVKFVNLF